MSAPRAEKPAASSLPYWIAAAVIALAGIFLRMDASSSYRRVGFDELLYRGYALKIEITGLIGYDKLSQLYIEHAEQAGSQAELPPTRFLYIICGWAWKQVAFGDAKPADMKLQGASGVDPMLISLRRVAGVATSLLMLVSGVAAWRMAGRTAGLAVLALCAFSPLLIHMSQHALIDGFFALWATLALWTLWENLRKPGNGRWLAAYGLSLTAMVLTKENSFFVFVALCGLIVLNRWCRFGEVRPALLVVTVAAPALAVLMLVLLAGGPGNFVQVYRLLVTKAGVLPYAIKTGDGPWHRYLVDLMIISPVILCLAMGAVFWVAAKDRSALYFVLFMGLSYLIMCNVKYGMNLRYATIWDLPLRYLAVVQLAWLFERWPARQHLLLIIAVAALCAYDFRQYQIFFVDTNLYELSTPDLLRAEQILK